MMDFWKSKIQRKALLRSLMLQGCNTYTRQQGLGYGYAMIPMLKEVYRENPEGYQEALLRNTGLFNITPQCVNFVMGITMAMEEEAAKNEEFDRASINAIKTSLMGPLSGIGDAIFWGSLRTIAIGVALTFSQSGSILGPLSFFLIYNVVAWIVRIKGQELGYKEGVNFLASATEGGLFDDFTMASKILGATVVGYMIAATINFITTITFTFEYSATAIQADIFDKIMPNFPSLLLAFVTFHYVKKGTSANKLLLALIVFAFVIAAIESIPFLIPAAS